MSARGLVGGAVLAAALALAGCANYAGDVAPPGESAEAPSATTTTAPAPEPVPATALAVGDCADDPEERFEDGGIVQARRCDRPHDLEVVAEVPLGDDAAEWPGATLLAEAADEACLAAFEAAVGEPWAESSLDYLVLAPAPADWADGARTVRCAVVSLSGEPLGAPVG